MRAFIYKIITVASLFTMLAASLLGREALINLYEEGPGTLTGKVYYLTEFREYISKLYTYGMLGYAGAGDDKGYPLTGNNEDAVANAARDIFKEELLKGKEDILYHINYTQKNFTMGNFSYPLFSEYDGHLLLPEDVILCCYWDGPRQKLEFFTDNKYEAACSPEDYYTQQYKPNTNTVGKVQLLLAIPDTDYYESAHLKNLAHIAKEYQKVLFTVFTSAVLFLFFGILSLLSHKVNKVMVLDLGHCTQKLWLEAKLLLLMAVIYLCYTLNLWYFNGSLLARFYGVSYLWLYGVVAALLYLFINDLKQNKGNAFRHSLLHALFCTIRDYIKGVYWYRKASKLHLAFMISAILCMATGIALIYFNISNQIYYTRLFPAKTLYVFGAALSIAGIIMLLFSARLKYFLEDTATIANKLADISNGVSKTELSLSRRSLLTQAAYDLSSVEQGIETAVEQNIRANKMRVELITNVSHDLKTPLTSIINYADLLCEEALPAPADEYATALRSKAYRLKGMVQDVFELSKATSGNLPMEKVRLDLAKLVRQTLADMDERIQESSLTFKLNIVTEPLMIEADGEKLYRVFQNLIINALQYSLENSRVYIQLDQKDTNAVAWIKNISKQELDFDPEEIVERFVRADASRTTEGSGLGLSIVQSFTEACGGSFTIELNADLFTACVSFPLSQEPLEEINKDYEKDSDNESN